MKKNKSKNLCFRFVVSALTICFVISLIFFLGEGVFAQINTGLDDTAGAAGLSNSSSIAQITGKIINVVLGFLGVIFVILLIYGGFMRMTAQGDSGKVETSMKIITSAVIGVIIIIAAYTITAFVMSRIETSVGNGGSQYEIDDSFIEDQGPRTRDLELPLIDRNIECTKDSDCSHLDYCSRGNPRVCNSDNKCECLNY